jgi:hypothetical protein
VRVSCESIPTWSTQGTGIGGHAVFFLLALMVGLSEPASATSFNLTFDASTAGAPAAFFTAFNNEIQFYQALFSDPIVINLHVGWGDINGSPLNPGNLGQSLTNQQAVPYAVLKAALLNDAKTAADVTAVVGLPSVDPTPGQNFAMSNAEAKALGLLAATAPGIDGWVGFNSTAPYTFDPNNRAVSGAYDFLGLADHEITEVMGRYGFGQNGSGARDSPIDLFRYSSPGVRDLSPVYGAANYFSVDQGATPINTFNIVCCGDLSDWAGVTPDAYNAFLTLGRAGLTSPGDITQMDVLGYDLVAAVPEPATLTLLSVGLLVGTFAGRRYRLTSVVSAKEPLCSMLYKDSEL